jgi:acetyltransferase-like isoleucine patch superfamily enzyme
MHITYLKKDGCFRKMIRAIRYKWYSFNRPLSIHKDARVSPKAKIIFQERHGSIKIGERTQIEDYVYIYNSGADIEIGRDCFIGLFNLINGGFKALKMGDYVIIGANTSIIATNHGFADINIPIRYQKSTSKGILIEDDVWIGAGCKILDGVTIGRGSVIGAGSVVTKSIPEYSVAAGVPARVIYSRKQNI